MNIGQQNGRHPLPHTKAIVVLVGLVALSTVVAACTSTAGTPGVPASTGSSETSIPLATAIAGPGTSWAVVAMGHLGDPANTFWQMFHQSGASTAPWELSTPPGVASNGGLVATVGPSGSVTAGFEPSQGLSFSPLAQTVDEGSSWSQGLLPGGLVRGPDALASAEGRRYLALLRTGGGEVVANNGDLTTWTTLATVRTLAADPVTAACRITSLTAVTSEATGNPVIGAGCAHGTRPGLFSLVRGHWQSVGPVLPGSSSQPSQVVGLLRTRAGVTALVSVGSTTAHTLFALWSADGSGSWTVSAPLRRPAPLTSTSVTATGGFVVTGGRGTGRTASEVSPGAGARWERLPTPPSGTAVVVDGPAGTVALVVDLSTLQVDSLDAGGWHRIQTLNVQIQYGSSG